MEARPAASTRLQHARARALHLQAAPTALRAPTAESTWCVVAMVFVPMAGWRLLLLAAAPFEEPAAPSAPASFRLTPAGRGAVGGGGANAFVEWRAASRAALAARCTCFHVPGFPLDTQASRKS